MPRCTRVIGRPPALIISEQSPSSHRPPAPVSYDGPPSPSTGALRANPYDRPPSPSTGARRPNPYDGSPSPSTPAVHTLI
jgi:hypothetical protein